MLPQWDIQPLLVLLWRTESFLAASWDWDWPKTDPRLRLTLDWDWPKTETDPRLRLTLDWDWSKTETDSRLRLTQDWDWSKTETDSRLKLTQDWDWYKTDTDSRLRLPISQVGIYIYHFIIPTQFPFNHMTVYLHRCVLCREISD